MKVARKYFCWLLVLVMFVLLNVSMAFASASQKWEQFSENTMNFANNIVANNKYALEVKFTKKERYYSDEMFGSGTSPVTHFRVWAKHKTIVTAWATSNKKFHAEMIQTVDPEVIFAGGVHVGGSVRDLEKFFGLPVAKFNTSEKPGVIWGTSGSEGGYSILIYHKNNIITAISSTYTQFPGDLPVPESKKVDNFIEKTRKQMGFPALIDPYF